MTEMRFAKGLGFISYGEKLYLWSSQFSNQQEGVMKEQLN